MLLRHSAGHASASARANANNTGRVVSEIVDVRVAHDMAARVDDERPEANNASTSSSRRARSSPGAIRRAAGALRTSVGAFDLRSERRNARLTRGTLGLDKRRARLL